MFSRSKIFHGPLSLTHVKITATFKWDSGDPSVGIAEGWGEDTCAEIECGPFKTWITWCDFSFDTTRAAPGNMRERHRVDVDFNDPATWVITQVQHEYRTEGRSVMLAEADESDPRTTSFLSGAVLRLSELPEVLEVVREAWADANASARLSAARENVQMLEAEVDAVKWHMSASDEPLTTDEIKLDDLVQALSEAREEAQAAYDHARERGVS